MKLLHIHIIVDESKLGTCSNLYTRAFQRREYLLF